ncbi:MAG: hypothetical protein RL020_1183 [Pseudomonadota bacterium]|jgi:type II secretory pathway predicted ATPase ExeA
MYLDHFGLDSAPFNITSQTDFFYDGAARGATLDALLYAVQQGEGIVKVTGEVGSGKTMLCRMLLESLPDNVETIFLSVPSLKREEIVQALCIELGLDIQHQSAYQLLTLLQEKLVDLYANNQRVLALIDEAHAMPVESLEEIRLLSNLENSDHKLLQIILFGQPELDDHLRLPHMRQLKERITHSFHLHPLQKPEVGPYLTHRLESAGYQGPALFSDQGIKLMARASEGLTRRINIIADKSLLAAYSDNTLKVTPQHVRSAIRDSDFPLPSEWGKRLTLGAATLAAAGLIGFGLSKINWFAPTSDSSAKSVAAASTASNEIKTQTDAIAPEMPTGAALVQGTPEWHERNINKNNKLSKYTEVEPTETLPLAIEANIQQNDLKTPNSGEKMPNTASADEKLEKPSVAKGLDINTKLSTNETQPETTPGPKTAQVKPDKTSLTLLNTAQKSTKNNQADKTAPISAATKVAELILSAPSSTEKNPAASIDQSSAVTPNSPQISAPSKWLQERISLSKTWLASQASSQCVIQLLIADINNHGNVEYFLGMAERQIGAKQGIHVFPSEINGQAKYIVTYADKQISCQAALEKLPAPLKQSKPYIRSVELLRNEVKFPG